MISSESQVFLWYKINYYTVSIEQKSVELFHLSKIENYSIQLNDFVNSFEPIIKTQSSNHFDTLYILDIARHGKLNHFSVI